LLNQNKVHQILLLLKKGFSQQKTAHLANVSRSTVQRVEKRTLIENSPIPTHSLGESVMDCFNLLVHSEHHIPLELRGDVLCRYLDVRNQKLGNVTTIVTTQEPRGVCEVAHRSDEVIHANE
jgi:DNA-binding XRE family transcriptional regulator